MKNTQRPGAHLYSRGLLGLIPLVGAFAGLYLIILGIVKYKNKTLILIGTACIVFTVMIYSSISFYFNHTMAARKNFSVFAQPELNSVIPVIEFYKIEHGSYPDSLEQLITRDIFVSIYDPIPGRPDRNKRQFYYKHLADKYYLFSAGIDKIPFTSDDIFPSSRYFDSTKTGLVRPVKP